jgi:hypothetical protein
VEVYNPGVGTWRTVSPLFAGRDFMAGGAIGGRLYVVGGLSGGTLNQAYMP